MEPEMQSALEKWAAEEFRSTNGHIEWLLNQALSNAGRYKRQKQTKETNPPSLATITDSKEGRST